MSNPICRKQIDKNNIFLSSITSDLNMLWRNDDQLRIIKKLLLRFQNSLKYPTTQKSLSLSYQKACIL